MKSTSDDEVPSKTTVHNWFTEIHGECRETDEFRKI